MIGSTISHYTILEKIGEGGMGVVYKAEDLKLKRIVALKFLPPSFSVDDEIRLRFIQEAQAASALNHTNICGIHAIEEFEKPAYAGALAGKQQFIDMEFVEGKTLGALLKERELSLKEVLEIAIQIAEGLNAAHKKGIVHRDIKPDNIMITDEHLVKIMDFGLAKLKGSSKLTKTHSTVGTLSYMSPEQAQGVEVDHRSDIFSFGVVLYEMITGRRPFKGEHEAAVIYSLVNETPEPLARYRANVPEELQRMIDKALAKDREERYQHADEIITDLRRIRQEIPPTAKAKWKTKKLALLIGTGIAVVALVTLAYFFWPAKTLTVEEESIAVLPFVNMSADASDEYFSDGMTEELIDALARIEGLHVAARTSSFVFKGKTEDISEIGRRLHVSTVLEGSIRESGTKLRVTAQLIKVTDGFHLWSQTYERELNDAFVVQDDISRQIVSALKITLSGNERQVMSSSRTVNSEAHDLYLRGRFFFNQFTWDGLQRSVQYYRQSLEKDPTYAAPYVGIALAYAGLSDYYLPPNEACPLSKAAAQKALEIDSMNGEAHAALGYVLTMYEWKLAEGKREIRKALQLSPNSANTLSYTCVCAAVRNEMDEALEEINHAISLDPLSPYASCMKEFLLYFSHRYDDVIQQHQRTAQLDSTFVYWDHLVGAAYREKNMLSKALEEYKRVVAVAPQPLFGLAITYARMGRLEDARRIVKALEEKSKQKYVSPDFVAMIYANLNEKGKAFEWLEKAYESRSSGMMALKLFPEYDPIRSDPRFVAMLKKVGLEP